MVRGNNGYDPDDFYQHMDFQTDYLKTVFNIMGISDITHVPLNGVSRGQDPTTAAEKKIKQLLDD